MVKILQKHSKVLRQKAEEVPLKDIGNKKLNKILLDMKTALASQLDGVAIAAPQISVALRVFVVSGRVKSFLSSNPDKKYPDSVYINPKITKLSKEKELVEEGCLSVRYLYGKVKRSTKTTVAAYDENGKRFTRGASGLVAQIFQHEIDHLDGILFTDKAKSVEEIPPEIWEKHFGTVVTGIKNKSNR